MEFSFFCLTEIGLPEWSLKSYQTYRRRLLFKIQIIKSNKFNEFKSEFFDISEYFKKLGRFVTFVNDYKKNQYKSNIQY